MNPELKIRRHCKNCQHYNEETMICSQIGKVEKPYCPVCSWFKILPEKRKELEMEAELARKIRAIERIAKKIKMVKERL